MARLTIDIEARLASFQDTLNNIERSTGRLAGRLDKAFSGVAKSLGPLAAVLGGGLFANFIKGSIEAQAALDDLSESTSLSVEFLSQLKQLTQVTGADLDGVAAAAGKFARSIGEALGGDKGAQQAFRDVGISVDDLRTKGIDELFTTFAKAIAEAEDPTLAIGTAVKLAGREAANQIPTFRDLATIGLEQANVSTEQAAKAEQLLNSMRRLQRVTTDLGNELATLLVPRLADIAEELTNAVAAGNSFVGVLKAIGQVVGLGSTQTEQFVRDTNRLLELQRKLGELESTARPGQRDVYVQLRIDTLREEITLLDQTLQAQRKVREQQDSAASRPAVRINRPVANELPKVRAAASNAIREVEDYTARINQVVAGAINDSAVVKTRELQDAIRALDELFLDGRVPIDIYASALEKLTGKAEDAKAPVDELAGLLARTTDAVQENANRLTSLADNAFFDGKITERQRDQLLELVNGYQKAGDAAKESGNAARDLGLIFVSSAEDAIAKWEGFGKFFKGLEQDLLRFGTRKLLTEPLINAASGLFGKAGGGDILGSLLKFVGFRASGGPVLAGAPYIVGERGPELVVPRQSGTVMPTGSYGGVTVNINASGSMDRRSAQQLANEVGRAVTRATRRNG